MRKKEKINPEIYDKEYYSSSNYANYFERADRYKKTANELVDLLGKLNLVDTDSKILDFGCAVGFLGRALMELGLKDVSGFEVSSWAAGEARNHGLRVYEDIGELDNMVPKVMFVLDVFEHMTPEQIHQAINLIKPQLMVVRIPCALVENGDFHLEISRQDPTHINCLTKEQWISCFRNQGYNTFISLNLYTIYDSPGVMCGLLLKNKDAR